MPGTHPKEYRRGWSSLGEHTRCVVEFFTWSDNGPSGVSTDARFQRDVGSIVAAKTSKTFGQASGKFTLTVKKPQKSGSRPYTAFDYQKLWRDPEGVWALIVWQLGPDRFETTFGMVDAISASTSRSERGARNEVYEIHGRDFGKVFEDTILFVNQFSSVPIASYSFLLDQLSSVVAKCTPDQCVMRLIDAWIGNNKSSAQAWELPSGLKNRGPTFYSTLSYAGVQTPMVPGLHGVSSEPRLLDPAQQGANLWDMLQHYSNGEMNELWVDLAPSPSQPFSGSDNIPTVFLRERPFPTQESSVTWQLLKTWQLTAADVKERNVAKGGSASRFNYWVLYPGGSSAPDLVGFCQRPTFGVSPGEPGSIPIADMTSIRRYGLKKWERSTLFCPANLSLEPGDEDAALLYSQVPTTLFRQLLANWLKKIHDWYAPAPMQLSGQIVCSRLFPEIRIGHRLTEETPDGSIDYYVEGVEHSWAFPGPGRSTFTVTRGQYSGDDLLAVSYAQRSNPVLDFAAEGVEQAQDGVDPTMVTTITE